MVVLVCHGCGGSVVIGVGLCECGDVSSVMLVRVCCLTYVIGFVLLRLCDCVCGICVMEAGLRK